MRIIWTTGDLLVRHPHRPPRRLGFGLESVLEVELGADDEDKHAVEGQGRRESGRGVRHDLRR